MLPTLPLHSACRVPLLPLLGVACLSLTCDILHFEEALGPSDTPFAQGYVYIHPDDKYLYALDMSDVHNPVVLTKAEGMTEFGLSRHTRQVAYVAAGGKQLYVLPVQGGPERLLVSAEGVLAAPTFSPSGKQVAFSYSDGPGFSIGIVQVDGSGFKKVNFTPGRFFSPNFKTEQTLWAVSMEGSHMALVEMDVATGAELNRRMQVGLAPLASSSRLVLSPDGRHVAWSAAGNNASGNPRIFVWGLETGAVWQLSEHGSAEAKDFMPSWKDGTTVLWTTQKDGGFHAFSADFQKVKTEGQLELKNSLYAVYVESVDRP